MATGSFARTFADIDLDDGNQDSVPLDCYNEEDEELYEQVMSMEEEGFHDGFLCSVFDYLVSHESEAKAFLVKNKKHKKNLASKIFPRLKILILLCGVIFSYALGQCCYYVV
ncbi:hypothetical protein V6Z12_A05G141400 [Gossypium hirsutum]